MKIGIMGGTFDPIHNGHLMLGEYAYDQFQLDEVWFMPNGNPPHKKLSNIQLDAETRVHMVALAIMGKKQFRLETYEAQEHVVSCTYRTMEHFRDVYPEDELYFIIGADSLFTIETWKYPDRIFPTCTILAAYRNTIDTESLMEQKIIELEKKYNADIRLLQTPLLPISSRELRSRLQKGNSVRGLVPETVRAFIDKEGLYKET